MILAHTIFHHNGQLLIIYMLVLTIAALWYVYPEFSRNRRTPRHCMMWLGILTFLMALFPIQSGDFTYYGMLFTTGRYTWHMEDFYVWLWDTVGRNYPAWRVVVWGASTILLLLSIRRLNVNLYFASFIFVITQWFYFGTMRNMLGFMAMFYGVILIFTRDKIMRKTVEVTFGILLIIASIFFHRSMFAYVIFLSLALIPFGKRTMGIGLIVYPFLYMSVYALSKYVMLYIGADEESVNHADVYLKAEQVTTRMQTFNNIITFGSYAYLIWIIVKNDAKKTAAVKMPYIYQFLTRYSYLMMYAAALFFMQIAGSWMYIRFIGCGTVSLMFVLMYYFYHYPRTLGVRIAFAAQIYIIAYNILYIMFPAHDSFIRRIQLIDL